MKRWTIKEINDSSDLKFAACILNERRAHLSPYTPLALKLKKVENILLRMDAYPQVWGSGSEEKNCAAQSEKEIRMNRMNAVELIHEIFDTDTYGFRDSMTDEQTAAIKMALNSLEHPECMCCGYCQRLVDEDSEGEGWCEEHDRPANCSDSVCGYYE